MRRRTYRTAPRATGNAAPRADIIRNYASVSEIIDAADAKSTHYPSDRADWTYGGDWTDEPTTRAGLLAGEAPAAALAAYEALSSQYSADTLNTQPAPTRRRRQVWSDQGDEIDTDRMNARHDRPWRATVIGRNAPIIRLALNIGLSGGNDSATFAQVAATAAAIADALTLSGYSVEIIGVCATQNPSGSGTVYTFPLKSSHEPLDARRILSASAPGLLRAYLLDQCKEDNGTPTGGTAALPRNLAEIIGTPHIIARHWENGTEISPAEQARRIIDACKSAAA